MPKKYWRRSEIEHFPGRMRKESYGDSKYEYHA